MNRLVFTALPCFALACAEPSEVESPAVCPAPLLRHTILADSATPGLFQLVDAPALTNEQERIVAALRDRPTTADLHFARLPENTELLLAERQTFLLRVAPDRAFLVEGIATRETSFTGSSHWFWRGDVLDGGDAYFSYYPDTRNMLGYITSRPIGERHSSGFMVSPLTAGLVAVTCIDSSKYGPD